MFRSQLISRSVLILTVTMGLCAQSVTTNKNYTYLALGDSISFGYSPLVTTPTPDEYTGYPEVVARTKNLLRTKSAVNASCPGETSGSFLVLGAPDNGCLGPGPQGQPGFKYSIGLHTDYTTTQAEFGISELSRNRRINLVTLSIGGNDLLLVAQQCAPEPDFAACVGPKIGPMLASYAQNLAQILTGIRVGARYTGKLILVKYYAINTDPLFTFAINELNKVMVQVGTPFGAKFADSFRTFQLVSALFQGDPCKAGLLIRLNATACDVHPSPSGRDLIAATVLLADLGGISILGQTSTE